MAPKKKPEVETEENGFKKGLLEMKIDINYALLKMKSEIGVLTKDSTNPFFKSKYMDLPTLLSVLDPLFDKWGLLLLQPIQEGRVYTRIILVQTGEHVESYMDLIDTIKDPQKIGSSITYFRRYTLESLLGLRAEDDDGNGAAKPSKAEAAPTTTKKNLTTKKLELCKVGIAEGKTDLTKLKETYLISQAQEEELKAVKVLKKITAKRLGESKVAIVEGKITVKKLKETYILTEKEEAELIKLEPSE